MAAQAALPPDLTDDDIHFILENLDMNLNCMILQALTHGLYTGVLGVTLWSIFRGSTKNASIVRYVMVLAIIALYVLATIALGPLWALTRHVFIDEGQNCYTVFLELDSLNPTVIQTRLVINITACISTFIADSSLIWRCWIVWGRQWLVVIVPALCTILGTVFKGLWTYHSCLDSTNDMETSTFDGSGHGAGIRSYRGVIEALIESAVLYSAVLIIDIVFVARDILSGGYVDILTAAIRGIAPTLLVGRVAAGHARPDDSWQESSTHTVSSLNFGTGSLSTQEGDITQSIELDMTDNIDPGLERNFAPIEEETREARPLDIV
ncbi:uncharacterized protein EV420DRAFT_1713622 [Desarmillaria tabescens]|uniref:Uncharacterized protein n=1 Tax=Armillaria tabescens TaxID=1929756 RepID=A0AA39JT22_ARMTA|nr:uncharacterized protein EV420DRAFT_1713622 [Desarmillaria tabescens]KAK0447375.1 hypothetical protein EV420DRAFT_1713622 [Desarmillaria tabescens]